MNGRADEQRVDDPRANDPGANDHAHMARALRLASRGLYTTDPNPRVGCVIVRNEDVIGEGWHARAGEPHAEVRALEQAGQAAAGATAYVTLEPCCHEGRTPPCTDAIISSGIRRVVVAMTDPYPKVAGQGIHRLRGAEVSVEVGVAEDRAGILLAPYLKLLKTEHPWVLAKWAIRERLVVERQHALPLQAP